MITYEAFTTSIESLLKEYLQQCQSPRRDKTVNYFDYASGILVSWVSIVSMDGFNSQKLKDAERLSSILYEIHEVS